MPSREARGTIECGPGMRCQVSVRGEPARSQTCPCCTPKSTPAVLHAESNVGTNQQPQSAQQPQSLDSDEEEVLRLEEEKAKEVELQIQREAQLMDQWCSWEFCNNAGCASKQCWCFEWGVEQVSWFLRICAVVEPKAKASYLVERCRVDSVIVADCLLDPGRPSAEQGE